MTREVPIKMIDVRLVIALQDPDTGAKRDVIVRHLRGGAPHYEREYGSNIPRHTRYIAGEDIEIDWPEPEIKEEEREINDTARREVEEITFFPSVLSAPLPPGVEDELIKPYSTDRLRHEKEWVTRKIVEDARSMWYEERKAVTPQSAYLEKESRERQVPGFEKAKEEMWDVIAKEQMSAAVS